MYSRGRGGDWRQDGQKSCWTEDSESGQVIGSFSWEGDKKLSLGLWKKALSGRKWTKDVRASGMVPWRQRKPELTEMGKGLNWWDVS